MSSVFKITDSGPQFTPIPNYLGQTALHEVRIVHEKSFQKTVNLEFQMMDFSLQAISQHSRQCVTTLLKNIIPSLNDVPTPGNMDRNRIATIYP